ncbi:ABC transporter substrate-binding protein [Fimbriimonas ginsengisoli]|uniref:Periplasmic binding protein/LacI transcriptional regulator n=1 Tax=Fimbriimonas ginsengisoli Gsoil 348 TaxID=661478 RepID=A0A068NTN0_FIMGI|nr:ABC transporter substrate-binding protein [Fimbriimonas ginsengisoli]AIE86090.1 periplasmic binding protein/LacI transcriptional regulator [Fimbriimonas ginsengisoli Gsoil 348]
MKRMVRGLALGGVLVGILSGCAPAPSSTGGASASTQTPGKRYKIGVSIPAADHGWTAGVVYWAKQATAMHPEVDWVVQTAETSSKQVNDIETMMTQGVDGMVVLAVESGPLTPVAEKVHQRGIFLVNVDRGFLKPVADVFLEGDNVAFGRKSAEFMAQKLGGKGDIVVLQGIPCTVNTDRVNAAMEVFKRYPGIHILDSQSGMWNRQKARDVMQTMLVKYPKFDAVWAQDDDMALGAEQALKEGGRTGVWMLGGAGMKDIVKRVMEGDKTIPADITYPPSMIAAGIHIAASSLRDGQIEKAKQFLPRHMKLDVELVEPANAKEFYFPDSVY